MIALEPLLREHVTQAVGWALLHFIWQGALIGAGAAVALRLLRHSAADVRYVVAAIALSLMATMPVMTAVQRWRVTPADAALVASIPQPAAPDALAPSPADTSTMAPPAACDTCSPMVSLGARVEPALPVLVLGWMVGVCLLAVRLAGGWLSVQRMKGAGAGPADPALQAIVVRLTRTLHITRPIRLLQAASVDVPTVIGWLKPVVLLPIGALAGLSPLQIEAILAHELAHVRRHDYLVNLLQTLVETLLFYHPAVWWLSRRIRIEREHCCDDLAVRLCGDPVVYARALADLEELRGAHARLVLAASGGSLVERVRRLLATPPTHAGRGPAWLAASTALLLLLAIVAAPSGREPVHAAAATLDAPTLDAPGDAPLGQGIPAPPAPPSPPAAPSAPAGSQASHEISRKGSGTISWSSNGDRVVVNYEGSFTVNDTDTDIATLSPGAYVRISDGAWLRGRSVEIRADGAGALTREFRVGNTVRPFEPEGREWLGRIFPRFVRQSGINAPQRVARFLTRGGPDAVLAEISLIEGSYGKRLYFAQLIKQASLDAASARRVLEQAGREIDSDYELATLLIDVTGKLVLDDAARQAYFAAARRIESDYEMRRVYTAALKGGTVPAPLLISLLEGATGIDSDYEAATLLLDVVKRHPIAGAVRAPFFTAVAGIDSSYEKGRVLQALLRRAGLPADTLLAVIDETASIGSSYEAAQVLLVAARSHTLTGAARTAYLRVADRLGDYEQSQVLAALK
jgi:beta-lactamase regulating signal transducer with metallopeptidase domain